MKRAAPAPVFFASPEEFRDWLAEHHASATELWVGYHKKGTGRPSMTWPQSVDEVLCYGWIDGIRKSVDDDRYMIRFTPRKRDSVWSAVNLARVEELTREGRMQPAGLAIHAARDPRKQHRYSFEQLTSTPLAPEDEATFRGHREAWAFFEAQPPGYRRVAMHWDGSAKKPETRAKRLATLIDDSAAGRRLDRLAGPAKKRST